MPPACGAGRSPRWACASSPRWSSRSTGTASPKRASRTRRPLPTRRLSENTRETSSNAAGGVMRALQLLGDRDLRVAATEPPPAPIPGEVQIRVRAVGLNHIDVWGFRGMAFAKRKLPLAVGAEASGEVTQVGSGAAFTP